MSLEERCLKPSPASQVKAVDNQRKNNPILPEKAILTTESFSKNSQFKIVEITEGNSYLNKVYFSIISIVQPALRVYFQHRLCCICESTEAAEQFGRVL